MCTLITLVGQQSSAVAVTAKTLWRQQNLRHIILLPTEQTKDEAHRLRNYFEKLSDELCVETCYITTDPEDTSRSSLAWDLIQKKLKDTENPLPEPIYYDTSPGLNYQVALISYHLRNEPRLQPLYASYNELVNLNNGNSWELGDIGLLELLDLYELKTNPPLDIVNPPKSIFDNLTIATANIPVFHVVKCVEHRGHLHGLLEILRQKTSDREAKKKEDHRLKQEARKIAAILETPAMVNRLHPILTVNTNDTITHNRLRAYGINSFVNEPKIIEKWQGSLSKAPGWKTPGKIENPIDLSNGPDGENHGDGTWVGNNLIVALGEDPSSTLLAIFTHKPREVIILVDQETEWVKAMASRIKEQVKLLGASELSFWPIDIKGNIYDREKFIENLNAKPAKHWDINITPGTKAQTWKLSRFPDNEKNIKLWSLYTKSKVAKPLISINIVPPLAFTYPPITLQASCRGGKLKEYGFLFADVINQKDFLMRLINVVSRRAENHDKGRCPLPAGSWNVGRKVIVKTEKKWPAGNHTKIHKITCLEIDGENNKIKFKVEINKNKVEGWVKSKGDEGHWLESPVAGAFLNAGSSQGANKIYDLVGGLRWAWLDTNNSRDAFRTDIDIILLWKGQYIAISVKSFIDNDNLEELEEIRNEIIAGARKYLGRFALPVLVRGGIPPDKAEAFAYKSIESEPLEIGLSLLKDSDRLRDLVEKGLEARRTIAD